MPPKTKRAYLEPLPYGLVPFAVGEKVAFREDHGEHPGLYGRVEALGLEDGAVAFDLLVLDPATGMPIEPEVVRRTTMEEIQ